LHITTGNEDIEAVKYLINIGTSPFITNNDEKTPLDLVKEKFAKAKSRPRVAMITRVHNFSKIASMLAKASNRRPVETSRKETF
jgi:hypothetical protein